MNFDQILEISPYSLDKEQKDKLLTERLVELTEYHRKNCAEYSDMLDAISYSKENIRSYKDLPFLPVRLFKELSLKSVPQEDVVKTMTSSGTSGQKTSKIYLDRVTSSNQQKTMVKIVSEYTGSARMPMIIVDCPSVVKDRNKFSARGAGILGFSMFGTKKVYALDDDMRLDVEALREFLEKYKGQKILLFGFTFMVWQYFYKELVRLKNEGITFDLGQGILIHGGGWKKLISEAVSAEEFHDRLKDVCGLDSVHDYYGMVEQTGCIYMQCECGHLHASIFSDVIARRPIDFSECDMGETGILQVVSTIPESYPGHSLLTEDEGIILGEDDCPCGRKGKYFKILGRIKNAEIRGCSDTFAADHSTISKIGALDECVALNNVTYLVGSKEIIERMPHVRPRKPFDQGIVDFLTDLSKQLMTSREAKAFSDVVTLGFWLRKGALDQLRGRFIETQDNAVRIGRGVAFHIAPSNVPVNYAYSLVTGLLTGNANVVRVPSRSFPQVEIINNAIKETLKHHTEIAPYIALVKYDKNRDVNDILSSLCDVRVIWGGDTTIAELRKSPLQGRATEITFADRYSLAVIDAEEYLERDDKRKVAQEFYNDTYLSDQNACTSPRLVVWMGDKKSQAKKEFWTNVYELIKEKYHFQQIQGVDKLTQCYLVSAAFPKMVHREDSVDNMLVRVDVKKAKPELMDYRGNSGYFYEIECDDISEIYDFCNNTHCQTVGLLGDKSLVEPLFLQGIKGVDRVVQIGHTMDFDLIWDGYNLVESLTRIIKS